MEDIEDLRNQLANLQNNVISSSPSSPGQGHSNEIISSPRLSERNTVELLNKMIELGYFHRNVDNSIVSEGESILDATRMDDSMESMKRQRQQRQQQQRQQKYSSSDEECDLIFTSSSSSYDGSPSCVTRQQLVRELNDELTLAGGRLSLHDASVLLSVDVAHVERAAVELCSSSFSSSSSSSNSGSRNSPGGTPPNETELVGSELLSTRYYNGAIRDVYTKLEESDGLILISDIADSVFRLSVDVTVRVLKERMMMTTTTTTTMEDGIVVTTDDGDGHDEEGRQQIYKLSNEQVKWTYSGPGGAKAIVTCRYEKERMAEIRGALRGVTVPTSLDSLSHDFGWDVSSTVRHVQTMCTNGALPGELRGGSGSGSGSGGSSSSSPSTAAVMYVPDIYVAMQRKGVDEFFAANGYITTDKCLSMGILPSKMGDFVRESFPEAVLLSNAVINPPAVVSPLEAVIQESVAADSFVDLRVHLPEALVSNEEDVRQIICGMVLPAVDSLKSDAADLSAKKESNTSDGITVTCDGEALFFSAGMIRHIQTKLLPPLVEAYGKTRAEEIDHAMTAETGCSSTKKKKLSSLPNYDEEAEEAGKSKRGSGKRSTRRIKHQQHDGGDSANDDANAVSKRISGKEKRRQRKGSAASSESGPTLPSTASSPGVVPLYLVAKKVAEQYPDLADIQEGHSPIIDSNEVGSPAWERVIESDDGIEDLSDGGGPLYEFCRQALYTTELPEICARAVKAELDRISSTKKGASVSSRKDGAARVRTIENAFEDPACYAAACHLVQLCAKFVQWVGTTGASPDVVDSLEHDFLTGCASDFTKRITEYCLFKNGVEDDLFSFRPVSSGMTSEKTEESDLPGFCSPVNMAVTRFAPVYLSCKPSEDGKMRDPLSTLRDILPGSTGVALARMWTMCGGECYEGGRKVSNDGEEFIRPGDFSSFLRHAEESCLTICGIPFKVLDKKSEKQALFARRHQLTEAIEQADEVNMLLDLTMILLFQQVRNVVVSGFNSGIVLDLLTREKKIPSVVSQKLKMAGECIHRDETVDDVLVQKIKDFGLAKDISKY